MTLLRESISDFSQGASLPADKTPAIRSCVGSAAAAGKSNRLVASVHATSPATADVIILHFNIFFSLWLLVPAIPWRHYTAAATGSKTLRLTQSIGPTSVIA